MAVRASSGFSYADLADFPDDHLRRELIGGELIVTPAPRTRHQDVVLFLATELTLYVRGHGGRTYAAPLDVVFSDDNVVEPDVLYLGADHLDRIGEKYVHGPPDLVVEVSSPSNQHPRSPEYCSPSPTPLELSSPKAITRRLPETRSQPSGSDSCDHFVPSPSEGGHFDKDDRSRLGFRRPSA